MLLFKSKFKGYELMIRLKDKVTYKESEYDLMINVKENFPYKH